MAENNSVEAISPAGELIWPCLLKPDTKFDEAGVYKTKLKVAADAPDAIKFRDLLEKIQQEEHDRQVQEAEAKKKGSGKKVKLADLPMEETDEGGIEYLVFNFKSKASYTDKKTGQVVERKIALFDGKGKALTHDLKIGSGTIARISVFVSPFYTALLGAGVTLRIRAVKILKLKEFTGGGNADAFGFGDDESDFEAEDHGFGDDSDDQDSSNGDDQPQF
ncbi:hypothetical protein C4K35_1922 [Pseudomonas chlororaphis subsp. piscium]|uniref:hypothetical protein n=1 Tax=Pseudomonas chlororaphis TaxID=587753 RepID=UPI000F55B8A6|nr:hypothetical protein [Pseudomonas chlororaphis]AZC49515.1 hypothetical protein C4K35_1922 [Pseudomonas chlororaphis subsp. piscium]